MTTFVITLLVVALYRFALPLVLQPSKRTWLLWGQRAGAHWSFMVGDHAPTLMFYVLRLFLPSAFTVGYLNGGRPVATIGLAGVIEIPIWGWKDDQSPPASDAAPNYIQTYYYLNLLNRRTLQIIKQMKLR